VAFRHGRTETRLCNVIQVPETFAEKEKWQGLKSLAMVTREYQDTSGKTHTGVRHYISNLPVRRAKIIVKAVRGHWSIENQLHWAMDVAFGEDSNRSRQAHAQANLEMLRRTHCRS
jgi:predicted transposase YbfD/YdcC